MTYPQSRRFAFTIQRPLDRDDENLARIEELWSVNRNNAQDTWLNYWSYVVFGYEVAPSTGKEHLQCFGVTKKKTTFQHKASGAVGLQKWFVQNGYAGTHFEDARASDEENLAYCKKGGNFFEWGELPKDLKPSDKKRKSEDDYSEALELATAGNIKHIPAKLLIKHYRALKDISREFREKPPALDGPCGIWVNGHAGFGKSNGTRRYIVGNQPYYAKNHSKWWDGYEFEDYVIFDDAHPDDAKSLLTDFKLWADAVPFQAEIKGAMVYVRPRHFIVTSQYRIEDIFPGAKDFDAIDRRFKRIDLKYKWTDPRAREPWEKFASEYPGICQGELPGVPVGAHVQPPPGGMASDHGLSQPQPNTQQPHDPLSPISTFSISDFLWDQD